MLDFNTRRISNLDFLTILVYHMKLSQFQTEYSVDFEQDPPTTNPLPPTPKSSSFHYLPLPSEFKPSKACCLTWQRERGGKGERVVKKRGTEGLSYSLITQMPCKCSTKEIHGRLQQTDTPFQIMKYWPIKVGTWGCASSSSNPSLLLKGHSRAANTTPSPSILHLTPSSPTC